MMICAQLMAFGRVHRLREEGKEERRLKKARADAVQSSVRSKNTNLPNGHIKTRSKEDMSETASNGNMNGGIVPLPAQCLVSSNSHLEGVGNGRYSRDTSEESEIIL